MVECTILSSAFDVFIQLLLAFVSFMILVAKWWFEENRRPVKVAAMDGSKQGGGFAVAHVFNMYLSMEDAPFSVAKAGSDPCQWYWVNIMLDTTVRVLITYLLFKLSLACFDKLGWHGLEHQRVTLPPPRGWLRQRSASTRV